MTARKDQTDDNPFDHLVERRAIGIIAAILGERPDVHPDTLCNRVRALADRDRRAYQQWRAQVEHLTANYIGGELHDEYLRHLFNRGDTPMDAADDLFRLNGLEDRVRAQARIEAQADQH